jgi:short-subunit dehydrogenase
MLAQETEAHIVNTASMAGFITGRGPAVYRVSKHAVVALSEILSHQLAQRRAKVQVSVLCPGGVDTQILKPCAIVRRTCQQRSPCVPKRRPCGRPRGAEYRPGSLL